MLTTRGAERVGCTPSKHSQQNAMGTEQSHLTCFKERLNYKLSQKSERKVNCWKTCEQKRYNDVYGKFAHGLIFMVGVVSIAHHKVHYTLQKKNIVRTPQFSRSMQSSITRITGTDPDKINGLSMFCLFLSNGRFPEQTEKNWRSRLIHFINLLGDLRVRASPFAVNVKNWCFQKICSPNDVFFPTQWSGYVVF